MGLTSAGAVADFVTIHPLFSLAPVAALCGLAWFALRRRRG
ncbi:MAG TPA: hypothetical protein VLI41_05185 [Phenylobacterium sp.]|nr:hypothetical protein [Phenylobacterium sp.]HSV02580.1 hypothetical protein [Phenylobacterium sp.]